MVNIIKNIQHPQRLTNHAAALRMAKDMMSDQLRTRYAIIITDGVATLDAGAEIRVAEEMRSAGINIIAIGRFKKISCVIDCNSCVVSQSHNVLSMSNRSRCVVNQIQTYHCL